MRLLVITLLAITTLIYLGIALVQYYPGPFLLVLDVKTRSPYCSLWQAIPDAAVLAAQRRESDRIAAASRLVRTDGGLELWETPLGQYWAPAGAGRVLPILLAQQERDIYGDADWGVREDDIVLDCGAHIGVYTRKALATGAKLVVAIEPSPDAVECLRRNLAEEVRAGRVIIYPKGVWDSEGELTLFDNGNAAAGNSFVVHGSGSRPVLSIPVTTIDQLVDELQLDRVDFIKADVKGSTEKALRGAARVIPRHRPGLALSTEEPPEDPASLAATVQGILPAYEMKCGPCLVSGREIFTDVVFFR